MLKQLFRRAREATYAKRRSPYRAAETAYGTADTLCCLRAAVFLLEEEDETENMPPMRAKRQQQQPRWQMEESQVERLIVFCFLVTRRKQRRGLSVGASTCGSSSCRGVNTEEAKLDVESGSTLFNAILA